MKTKNYWILLVHNFRKNRLQLLSFTVIILISALFLNLGLSVALNFNDGYRNKWTDHNMADASFVVYDMDYSADAVDEIKAYPEVKNVEVRDCLYLYGEFRVGDEVRVAMPMVVYNREDAYKMNRYLLVDSSLTDVDNAAYVSYWFYTDKGCRLGDTISYRTASKTYTFTIAGFVEDIQFGNNNCGGIAIHLSNDAYNAFALSAEPGLLAKAINIRTTEFKLGTAVYQRALQRMSGSWTFAYQYNSGYFEWNKSTRTLTTSIIAYMIVAFALGITVISLMICGFRIRNGIQEDMQDLGIQKSMGYQSLQIRFSVALPYLLLCLIGTALGIAGALAVLPSFNSLIEALTGLVWHQSADGAAILITFCILLCAVIFTVTASTRKVRRLLPVEALRSGIHHHSFKHNFVPLDKTCLPVTAALGVKNFLGSLAQNVVLSIIIAGVTFLGMFAASAYYNMMIKSDHFLKVVSDEYGNIYAVTDREARTPCRKDFGG